MLWKMVRSGKVRKIYENEEHTGVVLVAGDGVSAFDQKLGISVPGKGRMLTKISKYWFDQTADIVPNAYTAAKTELGTEFIGIENDVATVMLKLDMLPIEAIVRGYITGSLWKAYDGPEKVREFCGITLPDNLWNSEKLGTPIFTPTTKAPVGEHDENLSFEEMVEHLEKNGVMAAYDRATLIRDYSMRLYEFAYGHLLTKGIILADTKFEFGINPETGNIMLADELFTPDSSRFWRCEDYAIGEEQKSLDKQIIRDWVKTHPGEQVPPEVIEETALAYAEITEILTS